MLPCFKSKLLNQIPHVTHGFFTRNGGVSCGYYATLNTLERKTDNPQHVVENRRRIAEALGGTALQFNCQTHSTIVHHINEPDLALDGDALITQTPRLLIGVQTADCMPILIAHKTQKIVAAVHAGWQGALGGIIQSTLDELKQICNLNELVCAVGPCIAAEHLEVGEDVYSLWHEIQDKPLAMTEPYGAAESVFRRNDISSENTKWHLDLRALAEQIMRDYGVTQIDQIAQDTYSQPDVFFSYRRKTHAKEETCGGQSSIIGLI